MEIDGSVTDKTLMQEIDKKITLKHFKEKKTSRTYILGLDAFMADEKDRDKMCKALKKKLGTGSIKVNNEGVTAYGFQGDHRERIKEYLVKNNIAPKDKVAI